MGLRRLIPQRATAVVVTGILGAVGAAVLAPSAHASPIEYTSQCTNQTLPEMPIDPSQTKVDISVQPVKPTYRVGETITVEWKWLSYGIVPPNTPIVTKVEKDSTLPKGKIGLSGAQTREMDVEGERKNPETPLGEELIVTDMKGTVTLTEAGTVNLTPLQHSTWTLAFGYDSETRCLPTTPVPVGASITVEPGEVQLPVLQAPDGDVYSGSTIPLTGSRFTPSATPQVALCNADGSGCDASRFAMNTLAIDTRGNLSGTAMLYPFGIEDGPYVVRVSDGSKEATDTLSIKAFVPGERALTADRASGPVGTVVTLAGHDWTPNYELQISGVDADGNISDVPISVMTSPDGKFSVEYVVGAAEDVAIRAVAGFEDEGMTVPFRVTSGGALGQTLTGTITPGGLTMAQTGAGIDFGTTTLNGRTQTANAALNRVTVVDARGSDLGWQLTGTVSDLTSETGTIPAANVAWTPSCAAAEGSPSTVTSGSTGPIGSGATLCSVAPGTAGPTGGRFTAAAELALTVPAFAKPGSYTATLTLTLS
ncbi:hypothetical protein [Streptomyces sp. SID3343]|uniref:hypothetical protein n=1 Tax=Streptomyces sp. SID3343 TaxID=2690260 RepID=UPI00136B4D2B|nr:hypothetical protein [Streptomyces sp. SID3343]MYW04531.1 hypothetical protein [Streptomyces sp. SID3343]